MSQEVVWLVAGLILVIVELMTGTFYLLIFGLSAIIASAGAWLGAPFHLQAALAAASALVGVVVMRKRRHVLQGHGSVSPDLGQIATFEAWTDEPGRQARVRYRGAPWDADVEGAGTILPGASLEVTAVVGTRLKVASRRS